MPISDVSLADGCNECNCRSARCVCDTSADDISGPVHVQPSNGHRTTRGQQPSRRSDQIQLDFSNRLYNLFGLIEKEFDSLCAENLALRSKVAVLTERLGDSEPVDAPDVSVTNAYLSELTSQEKSGTSVPGGSKKASQVSQRLRTAFRVPPGRHLVSSFKANVGVGSAAADALRVQSASRAFLGHRDGVWDIAVAPASAGRMMVGSASADMTARLWCMDTGSCLAQYTGHSGSVNSIRFNSHCSAGEAVAVTAGGDRSAHIWRLTVPSLNIATQQQQQQSSGDEPEGDGLQGDEPVDENCLHVRSPRLELTGHNDVVICADWFCDGQQVITASWDHQANIYDAERGEILSVLSGHDQELTHARAHGSQKLVVTSSKDSTFRLWDFRDPIQSVAVFQGHSEAVTSAVFSANDKVISGSDDRSVKIWDLKNMRSPLATLRFDSPVNRLSVSTRFNVIAIPHDNRQVRLYDLNGSRIARLPRSNRWGHRRIVTATAWADECPANNGANLFTCGFDKWVLSWRYQPAVQLQYTPAT